MKMLKVELKTKILLYKQLIRLIISYGYPIWITANKTAYEKLAKLERRILRSITGRFRRGN